MNPRTLILFAPNPGVERGGGISSARIVDGPEVLNNVLERLGLPPELAGEVQTSGQGKANGAAGGKKAATAQRPAKEAKGASRTPRAAQTQQAEETETEEEQEPTEEAAAEEEQTEQAETETEEQEAAETEEQEATETEEGEPAEPEFTQEQQAWLDERNEEQTNALEEARTEATEAKERVKQLETQLANASKTPLAVAPISPLFTVDDPTVLAKEERAIEEFERWALEHWDGVEATEASADGKTPATPGYTAGQIRKRYAELKEVRDKVIPAARQAIETRKAQAKIAKQEYPELFDPKRPESQLAEQILRQAPGLKAIFPNIYLVLGDAMRGEKARLAATKKVTVKPKPAAGQTQNGRPKPPRPGAGAAATVRPAKKGGNEISAARYMELGGGRDALVEMLRSAELPTAER